MVFGRAAVPRLFGMGEEHKHLLQRMFLWWGGAEALNPDISCLGQLPINRHTEASKVVPTSAHSWFSYTLSVASVLQSRQGVVLQVTSTWGIRQ